MNYLPVSFLRWAPASAQQWFRHFHHHGRGDRHIWGWPVRGAGMYDGQILSQLKTKTWLTKGREDESRTEWPCGAPLERFATCSSPRGRDSSEANEQYNTSSTKTPGSVSTASVDMLLARFPAVTPHPFVWFDSHVDQTAKHSSHIVVAPRYPFVILASSILLS